MKSLMMVVLWMAFGAMAVAGTPSEADAISSRYRKEMEAWTAKLRTTTTPAARKAVVAERPDAAAYAARMWRCIGGQLDEEWTLKPTAWLFRMSVALQRGGMAIGTDAPKADKKKWVDVIARIRKALNEHHLRSKDPGLVKMCMALADLPDPETLSILEKIESGNPNPEMQGVAALAISMVLKNLGDEGEVIARRLKMLRKAIINSVNLEVEPGVTVGQIAKDELYIINHLSKGRTAPDLTGVDVAGRPIKLSDYQGKVVVLLFWATWNEESARLIEMVKKLKADMAGRPFELVGVNGDSTAVLRELVKNGTVTWPNFSDPERKLAAEYRISAWPVAFVLDQKRVIQYIGAPGSFVDLTVEALLGGKP